MIHVAARAIVLLLVGLIGGCTNPPPPGSVDLRVDNLTDTPLGVYVNDEWVGTDEPGATITATLEPADAGGYRIETRTPSGAVVAAFDAPSGAVQALREGRGGPLGEEVGVPCGVVRILIGTLEPDEALAPARSVEPGPCP